jgi:RHS repeat-associated protein
MLQHFPLAVMIFSGQLLFSQPNSQPIVNALPEGNRDGGGFSYDIFAKIKGFTVEVSSGSNTNSDFDSNWESCKGGELNIELIDFPLVYRLKLLNNISSRVSDLKYKLGDNTFKLSKKLPSVIRGWSEKGVSFGPGALTDLKGKLNGCIDKSIAIGIDHFGVNMSPESEAKLKSLLQNRTSLSVNSFTGNLLCQRTEFDRFRLFDASFVFSYNSGRTELDKGYGQGWTHNFDLYYYISGDTLAIEKGGGVRNLYDWGTLEPLQGGCHDSVYILLPNTVVMRTKHGTEFFFENDVHRHVTKVRDHNGNDILFGYTFTSESDVKLTQINYPGGLYELAWEGGKCVSLSDPNAIPPLIYTYQYDIFDNLISVTDPLNQSISYDYGYWSNLKKITDKMGNETEISFNAGKAVKEVSCPAEEVCRTFTYDLALSRTMVTDSLENSYRVTTYEFDSQGRCTLLIRPDGTSMIMVYDPEMNITGITDPRGGNWSYTYDGKGNLLTMTDPDGDLYTFIYEAAYSRIKTFIDPRGNITSYTYTAQGNLSTLTDPLLNHEHFTYDAFGQLTGYEDKRGFITTYSYDVNHNLAVETDPYGKSRNFSYDAMGNLISLTDKRGNITTYAYDLLERIISMTNDLGNTVSYVYDANNNLIQEVNERNYATTYAYDDLDRLISKTDALNNSSYIEYNEAGEITKVTDFMGYATQFGYDANGRQIREQDSYGNSIDYSFDGNDNLVKLTDRRSKSTVFHYTPDDRIDTVKNAYGSKAFFHYDPSGNADKITDFNGNQFIVAYDALDRVTNITDPYLNNEIFGYDMDDNLTFYTDQNTNTTNYQYDGLNRMVLLTSPDLSTQKYWYDEEDNLKRYEDKNGFITRYTYDDTGMRIGVHHPYGINEFNAFDQAGNRISYTDGRSNVTTFTFDALNRLIKRTDPGGHFRSFSYDLNSNRTSITDEDGFTRSYKYDALGRITRITDPLLNSDSTTYDAENNIIQYRDFNGNTTLYTYDDLDRLVSITDPYLNVEFYNYDNNDNPVTITDRNSNVYQISYDKLNRVDTITDPNLFTEKFIYDARGRVITSIDKKNQPTNYIYNCCLLIQVIDALGNIEKYTYDPNGNVITYRNKKNIPTFSVIDSLNRVVRETDSLGNYRAFTYDANNNLVTSRDKKGNVINRYYSVLDRLDSIADPLGFREKYFYNGRGNRIKNISKTGDITLYSYDGLGRMIQSTDPLGYNESSSYDNNGNRTGLTDKNAHVTTFSFDQLDRLVTVTRPDGLTINYSYDPVGNKISESDANGHITFFAYDALGRLTRVKNPLNDSVTYSYDPVGNKISETDFNGSFYRYSYDPLNRLVQSRAPYFTFNNYQYDANSNMTAFTDANNHTRTFQYDVLDRLTSITSPVPLLNTTAFNYDANGNIVNRLDPNLVPTNYSYDGMNRLLQTQYPDGSGYKWQYNAEGKVIKHWNEGGFNDSIQNVYDAGGRIVQKKVSYGNLFNKITGYTYDPVGNRLTETQGADVFTYSYDLLNRMVRIQNPTGDTTHFNYDGKGNRVKLTHSNLTEALYEYDNADHLKKLTWRRSPVDTIVSYAYTNDRMGNRTMVMEKFLFNNTTFYGYDSLYRLMNEASIWGPPVNYAYDPAGNRMLKIAPPSPPVNYIYDNENRLVNDGTYNYFYDANGNLVLKAFMFGGDTSKYYYDFENRLTRYIHSGIDTIDYIIGVDGNRISREASPGTFFGFTCSYCPFCCKWYCEVNYEYDGTGNVLTAYTNGPHNNEHLSLTNFGYSQYYVNDEINSVVALTDEMQYLMASYSYDAFGVIEESGGMTENPYRYAGLSYEPASGLYYNVNRTYSPDIGRFTSQDPLGRDLSPSCSPCNNTSLYSTQKGLRTISPEVSHHLPSISETTMSNLYLYAGNNPVNFTDPLGLFRIPTRGMHEVTNSRPCSSCGCSSKGSGSLSPVQATVSCLLTVNGKTVCTRNEKPCQPMGISNYNTTCTRECTQKHEEKHNADQKECCDKYRTAYEKAKETDKKNKPKDGSETFAERNKATDLWNDDYLSASGTAYFECRAYGVSVSCAADLYNKYNCDCPKKEDEQCCKDIKEYQESVKESEKENCGKPGANTPPRLARSNEILL